MSSMRRPLQGLRVLVTEDDPILALTTAETVRIFGGVALGPAGSDEDALALLARARPDAALLGVRSRGGAPAAVAPALRDRRVPFGLVTDLPASALDEPALRTAPCLRRPLATEMLRRLLLELAQRVEPSVRRLRAYDLVRGAEPTAAIVRLSGQLA
jgi:CheY-like chemotaxis protein